MDRRDAWFFLSVLMLLGLDQASKHWVLLHLLHKEPVVLMSHLQLVFAFNKGAAFGWLAAANGWQQPFFIFLAVCLTLAAIWAVHRRLFEGTYQWVCASMMVAGALGNALDRIFWGGVIDFIDFFIGTWHWYAFNFADVYLCIGALGWVLLSVWIERKRPLIFEINE